MNKKWKITIITSLVIFALEIAGAAFFLLPYLRVQKVFNSIKQGQWSDATMYYEKLNSDKKDIVNSHLDAYGAYVAYRYNKGELSYLEASASFDAINSISATSEVFDKYTPGINRNEYVRLMEELFTANKMKNSEKKYETIAQITDIQKRITSDVREGILIEMLNKKLDQYVKGNLVYEDVILFSGIVRGNSINSAYDYSYTIEALSYNIKNYRAKYDELDAMYDKKQYFEIIEAVEKEHIYDFDTEYMTRYKKLYDLSYENGKTYYCELLQKFIDTGDTDNAVKLMAMLENVYGNDLSLDFANDALMVDWQKAAVKLCEDWETPLKKALSESETGKTILNSEYDKLKPDGVALYDVNEDGYPELLLFNKARLEDNYTGAFLFGYDKAEKQYVYMNYVNVISFGIKSNILAFPVCFGRETGEEVCIYNYDGNTLTPGKSAQNIGDKYYIDGEETEKLEYLGAQTEIMLIQGPTRIQNSGYVDLEEYKGYIIGYENKYKVKDDNATDDEAEE